MRPLRERMKKRESLDTESLEAEEITYLGGITLIALKNSATGEIKNCPTGWSWTCLLLSFIVPLWRRDWKWGIGCLVISLLSIPTGLPIGIGVNVMLALMYNDFFIMGLYKKGFRPVDEPGNVEIDRLAKKYKMQTLD